MLRAIHAQEDRDGALSKAEAVRDKLGLMKLRKAAARVRDTVKLTLAYHEFPIAHWRHIRTSSAYTRILQGVRRRSHGGGAFPDGESVMLLVATRPNGA